MYTFDIDFHSLNICYLIVANLFLLLYITLYIFTLFFQKSRIFIYHGFIPTRAVFSVVNFESSVVFVSSTISYGFLFENKRSTMKISSYQK